MSIFEHFQFQPIEIDTPQSIPEQSPENTWDLHEQIDEESLNEFWSEVLEDTREAS